MVKENREGLCVCTEEEVCQVTAAVTTYPKIISIGGLAEEPNCRCLSRFLGIDKLSNWRYPILNLHRGEQKLQNPQPVQNTLPHLQKSPRTSYSLPQDFQGLPRPVFNVYASLHHIICLAQPPYASRLNETRVFPLGRSLHDARSRATSVANHRSRSYYFDKQHGFKIDQYLDR
jgi:hypothetical protein